MSMFNWELFTEETNRKIRDLLESSDIEYYTENMSDLKHGYVETTVYSFDFGYEPFLRVNWKQEAWSSIDLFDIFSGVVTETLSFGEPELYLDDFEVFKNIPDVEDFIIDLEDFSAIYHTKGEEEIIKDSNTISDSEVEPYRQKFFDRQIDALIKELSAFQEEYKEHLEEEE